MGALVEQFRAIGVSLEATTGGKLLARGRLTDKLRATIRANKPAILAELEANDRSGNPAALGEPAAEADSPTRPMLDAAIEARRQRVRAILSAHPDLRYAVITDSAEPGVVVVHIGIRGAASGEIVIAKARYDGAELLRALEKLSSRSK